MVTQHGTEVCDLYSTNVGCILFMGNWFGLLLVDLMWVTNCHASKHIK